MTSSPNIAATATYRDTWAGEVPVFLTAACSMRHGQRVTIYRWISSHGGIGNAGGFVARSNPKPMIAAAALHPLFSNVVAAVAS